MTIIDTHTHLDHIDNLEQSLKEADKAGVKEIVTVGVDLDSNKKNLDIQKKYSTPQIHIALGIHPGDINQEELSEAFELIRNNIGQAIAVGETGLDYWYRGVRKNEDKRREQKDVFDRQLQLSKEFDLPIIIHSRGAWKDCLAMTKEAQVKKALFHWYSGPVDILKQIVDQGYYVSTGPSVAYSPESRAAMAAVPIDRILLETDCPVRYKESAESDARYSSRPKDVWRALKALSELKGLDEQNALNTCNANAQEFFQL